MAVIANTDVRGDIGAVAACHGILVNAWPLAVDVHSAAGSAGSKSWQEGVDCIAGGYGRHVLAVHCGCLSPITAINVNLQSHRRAL